MAEPGSIVAPPKKILFATDMSSRCDRGLDRSVQLAGQWGASLLVVHALEVEIDPFEERRMPTWRRPPDKRALLEAQLRRDMLDTPVELDVVVEKGEAAKVVADVAEREGAGLIVTGVARDEPLGRYFVGNSVERLARRSPAPLLIVKRRVRRPYAKILVATDFEEPSRRALDTVAALFPDASLALLHAFDIPFAPFRTGGDLEEAFREAGRRTSEEFLAGSALTDEQKANMPVLIEQGDPDSLIAAYMMDQGVDLVAIGSHGRNPVVEALVGSQARRIIEASPGDVLLVR